jgi:transcriptional regulator of acetoin/glycerol metabolism
MTSNSEICKARTLFITRGILNREIIPTAIIYSWVRSKLHNISFELLDIKRNDRQFDILTLNPQGSNIIKYLRTIKLEDSVIYLSNADGTVIFQTEKKFADLPTFTNFSEEAIGTNAGGISVITHEDMTVSGCEHYNKVLINYMTSSVVIGAEYSSEGYIITIITPNKLSMSHNRLSFLVSEQFKKKSEPIDVTTEINDALDQKNDVNPVKTTQKTPIYDDELNNEECSNKNECKVFTLSFIEKKTIEEALTYFNWNLKKSAEALGVGRSTLYRKIKEYHISK